MSEESNNLSEFERALQESLGAKEARVGAVITGTIAAIHGDVVLVDISGKSEAMLNRDELDELGTGDPVEVVVVSSGDQVQVSRRLALERRLTEQLGVAAESGEPVEGKVVGRRKGGFDINISGIRGFCPLSQIDDMRSEDVDRHLGETYSFRILEYDPEDRKLVVSRAVLLREAKAKQREHAWATLKEGAVVDGTVRSLTDFGAFVDLGGVDGLVHVTELSHRRIAHPRDVLKEGETVPVKVLDLDQEKNRISLSIKQLEKDPWEDVEEKFPVRGPFEGTVVRKTGFGAFVELEPGLDGLLHVSQLPPGMELDDPDLEVGQGVNGWIREVDTENHRVGLTLRRLPDHDPWERIEMRYSEGKVVEAVVENGADFGVFVELEPGVSALVPAGELGFGREIDPRTALAPGATITAKVMSVDEERRRISLSIRSHKRDLERQEYQQHMDTGSDQPAMTGFGEQLMNALGKKPK
jgi:small subunit ribosomal protein S1